MSSISTAQRKVEFIIIVLKNQKMLHYINVIDEYPLGSILHVKLYGLGTHRNHRYGAPSPCFNTLMTFKLSSSKKLGSISPY